ncbi:MAG: hypothetical protein J5825_00495 [Lachnospiraceae bacterium]|nr:hypothetical protein [Lachnospiraceae bacterium]
MNCPFCGKEMESGHIINWKGNSINWYKDEKKPASLFSSSESVELAEFSFFGSSKVRSFICRSCKKVISDYSENS